MSKPLNLLFELEKQLNLLLNYQISNIFLTQNSPKWLKPLMALNPYLIGRFQHSECNKAVYMNGKSEF